MSLFPDWLEGQGGGVTVTATIGNAELFLSTGGPIQLSIDNDVDLFFGDASIELSSDSDVTLEGNTLEFDC